MVLASLTVRAISNSKPCLFSKQESPSIRLKSSSRSNILFIHFLLSPSIYGFFASFGISHIRLNCTTPGIRFSSQSFCIRRSEMHHFLAASGAEI